MSMYPKNEELEVFGKKIMFPGLDENGKFTNGDFTDTEKPASFIPAETMNLIIDNLSELIKACGKEPNNTDIVQLSNLITKEKLPNTLIKRDENGKAKIETPTSDDDIANKKYVDNLYSPGAGINFLNNKINMTLLESTVKRTGTMMSSQHPLYTVNDIGSNIYLFKVNIPPKTVYCPGFRENSSPPIYSTFLDINFKINISSILKKNLDLRIKLLYTTGRIIGSYIYDASGYVTIFIHTSYSMTSLGEISGYPAPILYIYIPEDIALHLNINWNA